ncbi:hypothetical protein Cadr_000031188 [Camelus dromedarius]|uniref:Uncharacterized protein n=1 Tax=Camelus dromedarius TaxID=9838 RepID=A0A5N4BX93_CAMDR|nr:hypothetical protein Cadr_000031188 [Camelus dromedarius]
MQRHRLEGWTREVKLELRALKGYRMVQRQVCRLLRGAPEVKLFLYISATTLPSPDPYLLSAPPVHLSPSTFPLLSSSPIFSLPRCPSLYHRTKRGSLALLRMRSRCQLDRGLEAPAPSWESAPKSSQLCRPVLALRGAGGTRSEPQTEQTA